MQAASDADPGRERDDFFCPRTEERLLRWGRLVNQGGAARRGVDAVDIDGLLLRNSETLCAHSRATEASRRAEGFLMGLCVVVAYSWALVVSVALYVQ